MTYNRKPCAALFLEPEYDALILEAYSKSRVTTERLKNGRYLFSCIFCKEIHKDKNMTSYHRMFNLCKVYKEHVALKMYLTWEKKSDHGELHMITKKYGKVFVINMPPKPSAPLKRTAEDYCYPPVRSAAKFLRLQCPNHLKKVRARFPGLEIVLNLCVSNSRRRKFSKCLMIATRKHVTNGVRSIQKRGTSKTKQRPMLLKTL